MCGLWVLTTGINYIKKPSANTEGFLCQNISNSTGLIF
ncbi:MAG: Uncharacterised protein [Cryomorphaceae bacterium]|nr:MAG: Uncharacterised protein [Cryomorphaceae bacterium]